MYQREARGLYRSSPADRYAELGVAKIYKSCRCHDQISFHIDGTIYAGLSNWNLHGSINHAQLP